MSYESGLSMEERVTSLFQPDTLLPDQYLDTFRRKLYLEPERKLMLAVLEDAIACYQKYILARDGKGKALFLEAEQWFLDENADWFFSFTNVCETLGLNAAYLRQGMLQWGRNKVLEQGRAKVYRLALQGRKNKRRASVSEGVRHRMRRRAASR